MAIETEIKIKLVDAEEFRRKLDRMKPVPVSERHFEDNFLFDFPGAELRSRGCLLRVRITPGKATITHKSPPQRNSLFKVREERETIVADGEMALEIFKQIGLRIWFRYQKYRQEYDLPVSGRKDARIRLAIDETPIGLYLELEGTEEGIRQISRDMGFRESQYLRDSYYTLYLNRCREEGREPDYMMFPYEVV